MEATASKPLGRIDQTQFTQQGIGQNDSFAASDIGGDLAASQRRFADDQGLDRPASLLVGFDQMHAVEQRPARSCAARGPTRPGASGS